VGCTHDDLAQVGLVDEQVRFGRLGDTQLDRVLTDRVIAIVLPGAKGPVISIRSMSAFQSAQVVTSDQRRQMDSSDAVVSTLCSVVHIGEG
jgi:hypothetical protein